MFSRIRFPLGMFTKIQVRERAREVGLVSAERAESQDLCFAGPEGHFAEDLRRRFGDVAVAGTVCDAERNVLARHQGVHTFTLGQRKGLGVATLRGKAVARFAGRSVRITHIDPATGTVTISDDPKALLAHRCTVEDFKWSGEKVAQTFLSVNTLPNAQTGMSVSPLTCQVRYQSPPVSCTIYATSQDSMDVDVHFAQPQHAVTPGQYLVVYWGDAVVGRGIIGNAE